MNTSAFWLRVRAETDALLARTNPDPEKRRAHFEFARVQAEVAHMMSGEVLPDLARLWQR